MDFLVSAISKIKAWCVRLALTLRRIIAARRDYQRCRQAERDAFNDLHYGSGSLYRWENAAFMSLRARHAYHRTLPAILRPADALSQADELVQLFEQVKSK